MNLQIEGSFKYVKDREGVENERQYEILKKMKCNIFQGYYFGKPVDKNTFEKIFLARSFNIKVPPPCDKVTENDG